MRKGLRHKRYRHHIHVDANKFYKQLKKANQFHYIGFRRSRLIARIINKYPVQSDGEEIERLPF